LFYIIHILKFLFLIFYKLQVLPVLFYADTVKIQTTSKNIFHSQSDFYFQSNKCFPEKIYILFYMLTDVDAREPVG